MPSEDPGLRRFMETVVKAGEENLLRVPSRRAAGGSAPGPGAVVNEGVSSAADIARQVAGMALRTAVVVGEQALELAGQLESLVGEPPPPRDAATSAFRVGGPAASAPTALVLPPATPGAITSADLDITNRGEDAFDPHGLRCDGLFGTGRRRIRDVAVTFAQVDGNVIPPRATARVTCTVQVPAGAEAGTYTGLIEAPDHPGVQLLVSLTVV